MTQDPTSVRPRSLCSRRGNAAILGAAMVLALTDVLSAGVARAISRDGHADPHAAPASHAPAHAPAATPSKPAAKPAIVETKPTAKEPAEKEPAAKPSATKPAAKPAAAPTPAPKAEAPTEVNDADTALKLLTEGNKRWITGKAESPNATASRRERVAAEGQKPFALVVTCADSRVPCERLFDRGVGDVFTVRVAGNIAGASEMGSVEYAVGHIKPPLMVVMGHTKCGAVAAAASGAQVHGSVKSVVDAISPAVERARRNNPGVEGAELTELAVKENVWQTVYDALRASSEVREAVRSGKLKIVGAVYDISTGEVKWMGEHPWQAELLTALEVPAAAGKTTGTAGVEGGH